MDEIESTHQKALRINQDGSRYGTFAEIGAGQEVVRWFFRVGKASATVAKSISAYDKTVSDEIYGHAEHFVSRGRLAEMLEYEYALLVKRLQAQRGATTRFFAFAETVATHSRPHHAGGHGWLGVRFQTAPGTECSEVMLHVQLLDAVTASAQDAIGKLGVNLLHGAFFDTDQPEKLIADLMDDLTRDRIAVDLIQFSGPAFRGVDNRLMSVKLIEHGLSDAALFTAEGEVVQPGETLIGKPLLIERGSFRPVTNVTVEIADHALKQMRSDPRIDSRDCQVVMEMTLRSLTDGGNVDAADLLARADTLQALGRMVMITSYGRFHEVVQYLRNYTDAWIVMAVGMPVLNDIFCEKYYTDLQGGILEAAGRLFKGRVKLYVYPMKETAASELSGVESLDVPPKLRGLAAYLVDNGFIEPITDVKTAQLHVSPKDVLSGIESGDPKWVRMVPPVVAELIQSRGLFGYKSSPC